MAYTNIDDSSAFFQTALYTGNATNGKTITNDGNSDLQPDWVWIKRRDNPADHNCFDSSRGTGKHLAQNQTQVENTVNGVTAFNTDGFTLSTNGDSNYNTGTFAAWQWKAGGGTTASNSNGSITSTVQANTTAGMSIVTYTGTGSDSTVGHGLGVAPSAIIIKSRSNALPWVVWTAGMAGTTSVMELNTTAAEQTVSNYWYNGFSSTTFGLGSGTYSHNTNNYTYVAYCFAEKQGYSKFGKYVGNGNASGPFVYTGFKPAFVMIKVTSAVESWTMFDGARKPFNRDDNVASIYANTNGAEYTGASYHNIDILSNGFKVRLTNTAVNASGASYIYMAFAENPFVTSTGIPTTAR